MKLGALVLHELTQRKKRMLASLLAIFLSVSVIVAIYNISLYSEKAVSRELDALGANILILPPDTSISDYYKADLHSQELPEEYVTLLATSNLEGLDNLSPKLSVPAKIGSEDVTLTGILPKNEFQGKASWQGAGIFSRPKVCGSVNDIFGLTDAPPPKETLVRKRVIETLEPHEVLVGADIAHKLKLDVDQEIAMLDRPFKVVAVLPHTGTVDDSRVFAHLHTVQDLASKGAVVNAIEVIGCCEQVMKGLTSKLSYLLPDAQVVTIAQIIDTQIKTTQLMKHLSFLFLIIMSVVGGACIANDMYYNVNERKKEIGILMALGAHPKTVLRLFLYKALLLGLLGGIIGFLAGSLIAVVLGPWIAGIPILPEPYLFIGALVITPIVTVLASYFPARYASRLDPSISLQDI